MTNFLIGFVVAWVIEWLLYNFWWKSRHPVKKGVATSASFDAERKRLESTLGERDSQISQLKARISQLETAASKPIVAKSASAEPATAKPAASKPKAAATTKGDDLKKVSGIGPKIADLLRADGIDSFAKLAKTDLGAIQSILKKAGPRYALADANSWSEQAQLLVDGKLDALEMLQASLKKS
jgi:predicted flap endonuclease-1-like 5' DNA nuclease